MTIEELGKEIEECRRCPLFSMRKMPLLGSGNIHSKIMFVGEAPGEKEDESGVAFVGPAGKVLDEEMAFLGLSRKEAYLCNVIKCRPPHNRTPSRSEQEACLPFLRWQFLFMRPRMMILLGSVASKAVVDPHFSIMASHGRIIERKGVLMCPTFHPSAILRDPMKKDVAWKDLAAFKEAIDREKLRNV